MEVAPKKQVQVVCAEASLRGPWEVHQRGFSIGQRRKERWRRCNRQRCHGRDTTRRYNVYLIFLSGVSQPELRWPVLLDGTYTLQVALVCIQPSSHTWAICWPLQKQKLVTLVLYQIITDKVIFWITNDHLHSTDKLCLDNFFISKRQDSK